MRKSLNNPTTMLLTLSASAAVLALAHLWVDATPATADVIKDRDYQLVTLKSTTAGESVAVIDNRTGLAAFFIYDEGRRAIVPKAVRPLSDAFITANPTERRRYP